MAEITDAAGDFLPTYQGPRPSVGNTQGADLDVLTANVTLVGSNLVFTSTQNGAVGSTVGGFYVWGINRGQGTARFPTLAPGVLFDSVVILRPGGQSVVTDLVTSPTTTTNLDASVVQILGNTITATVPIALLPSRGFDVTQYTVNLWPRFGGNGVTGDAQISDFAPNNSNFAITAAPEPVSGALMFALLPVVGVVVRRSRK